MKAATKRKPASVEPSVEEPANDAAPAKPESLLSGWIKGGHAAREIREARRLAHDVTIAALEVMGNTLINGGGEQTDDDDVRNDVGAFALTLKAHLDCSEDMCAMVERLTKEHANGPTQ